MEFQEHYALDLLRYMLGLDSMEIKAVAVEGVAKLMLSGIIKDPDVSFQQTSKKYV